MKYRKEKNIPKEKVGLIQKMKDYLSTTKLNYYLHKTISPKNTYLTALIIFSLFILISYFSYAMFTVYEERQRVLSMQAGSLSSSITSNDFIEETNDIVVAANSTKIVDITINNNSITEAKIDLNCIKEDTTLVSYLTLEGITDSGNSTFIVPNDEGDFILNGGESKKVLVALMNTTSEEKRVSFSTDIGLASATLIGTNYIIANHTDNPYAPNTIAYKLKQSIPFVKGQIEDYHIAPISNKEIKGTYHGIYVNGTYNENDYTCPENMEISTFKINDSLSYCKLIKNDCPSGALKYRYNEEDICIHYQTNEKEEFTLRSTTDENNNIVYYYRGGIDKKKINSYIQLGNLKWNVTRINEDGSLRLILTDGINDVKSSIGENIVYKNSEIKNILDTWYTNNLNGFDHLLIASNYCEDYSIDKESDAYKLLYKQNHEVYGFSNRLLGITSFKADNVKPTLACADEYRINSKIGLLTADEAFLAGNSTSTFLDNGKNKENISYNYLMSEKIDNSNSWLMSPAFSNSYYALDTNLGVYMMNSEDTSTLGVRPVITLKAGVVYTSGDGTIDNPYKVQ